MKICFFVVVVLKLLTSCAFAGGGGEFLSVASVLCEEPAPAGMVLIKRGSFRMGAAYPDSLAGLPAVTKQVSLESFWMDQTEVTNAQYRQFMHSVNDSAAIYPNEFCWVTDFEQANNEIYTRSYFSYRAYDQYPVVGVSWQQATRFCAWRTSQYKQAARLPDGLEIEPFRLPTEAEWEYAARAGNNNSKYPWPQEGIRTTEGCFRANLKPAPGNYTDDGHLITSRVKSFPPNDFGLYDMAGNVAEWTSAAYSPAAYIQMGDLNPDYQYNALPQDPLSLKRKVLRGGSWKDLPYFIRSDIRSWAYQHEQHAWLGFRCVRTQRGFSTTKHKRK